MNEGEVREQISESTSLWKLLKSSSGKNTMMLDLLPRC